MVKIIVSGCCGRMGRRIISLALAEEGIEVSAAVEAEGHLDSGKDVGLLSGEAPSGIKITDRLEEVIDGADCLIEFTTPAATVSHLGLCQERKKAMVIGTTGMSSEQLKKIKAAAGSIPIVMSPNMSVGVNMLFKLVEETAAVLGRDYEAEIIEAHHHFKKDSPSGTAKRIAEIIARQRNQELEKVARWGRKGMVGERLPEEIGVHAVRAGDIVGEHTVIFCAPGERIELIHRAHSRDTFARGALAAARFVVGKKPGLYTMGNVLGISNEDTT